MNRTVTQTEAAVRQIIETMTANKVKGFYATKGWHPFDPEYLSKKPRTIRVSNDRFWELNFTTIFYAGFRAQTVDDNYEQLCSLLSDYKRLASRSDARIAWRLIQRSPIRHPLKIQAVIHNARSYVLLLREFISAQSYISSYRLPRAIQTSEELQRLETLKADLRSRFKFYGPAVTDHFLMRLGFEVLKPDIIIRRLFYRLAITKRLLGTSKRDELVASQISRDIASSLRIPVSSLDKLLHFFGRRQGAESAQTNQSVIYVW